MKFYCSMGSHAMANLRHETITDGHGTEQEMSHIITNLEISDSYKILTKHNISSFYRVFFIKCCRFFKKYQIENSHLLKI
jgi:hypothetical protein